MSWQPIYDGGPALHESVVEMANFIADVAPENGMSGDTAHGSEKMIVFNHNDHQYAIHVDAFGLPTVVHRPLEQS